MTANHVSTAASASNTGLLFVGDLSGPDLKFKALIESRYPGYEGAAEEWRFINDALEGGRALAERHLNKHELEEKVIFEQRKKRAVDNHFPVSQLVLDTYEGYIFQNEPAAAEDLDDASLAFLDCADLDGRRLTAFAREVLRYSGAKGIVWACVDKPTAPAELPPEAVTAAVEAELKLAPYAYLVQPEDVLNGYYEQGTLKWLLVKEMYRNAADPFNQEGYKLTPRWRLWTEQTWLLITPIFNDAGYVTHFITEDGVNAVGVVPFVPFRVKEGTGFTAKGVISDVAHLDKAAFNICSLLDEILYTVTFPQLGIPYSGMLYDDNGLSGEGKVILTMGLHSVVPYSSEAGAPAYIAPPEGPAATLERSITRIVGLALSLALLDGEIGTPKEEGGGGEGATAAASGVSKSYVFEKLNRRLATISDTIETGFTALFKMVARWNGADPCELPPCPWDFPDNFEVRSLAADITEALGLLGLGINGDTLRAVILKAIVRKALPKVDEETLKKIEKEIDAGPISDYDVNGEEEGGGKDSGRLGTKPAGAPGQGPGGGKGR